jgi:U2 small nuclear ribonucleoprotein A'
LSSIALNNNKIALVAAGLGQYLPNLETLILTNNKIMQLSDLNGLAGAWWLSSDRGSCFGKLWLMGRRDHALMVLRVLPPWFLPTELPKLTRLSVLGNPVCRSKDYRLYLIALLPKLKLLDFNKVKAQVRCDSRHACIIFMALPV